jgi:hypothetical protein
VFIVSMSGPVGSVKIIMASVPAVSAGVVGTAVDSEGAWEAVGIVMKGGMVPSSLSDEPSVSSVVGIIIIMGGAVVLSPESLGQP